MFNGRASTFTKVMTPPACGVVTRRLVVGVISSMTACGGAACDRTSSASASSGDPIATKSSPITAPDDTRDSAPQVSTPKKTAQYALSKKSREIENLLDRGATAGAERLLNVYLNSDPGDAGLLAQYARFVIMTQPPSGVSWMTSPLDTSGRFRPLYIVANAASTARDLDPDIRPYLAEVLLSAYEQTSRAALDRGEGVISDPVLFMTSFEASLANIGWWAMEFDAARAERWSTPFESLAAQAARNGKVASAMMLGNLAGDLKQRGEGDQDFRLANKYFLESLRNVRSSPDQSKLTWTRVTLKAYSTLFADELAAIERGSLPDPNYNAIQELAIQLGAL